MKGFNIGVQNANNIINISGDFLGIITIEFQDYGQDFLEWDVCLNTGAVLDCRPFQASVWTKQYVDDPSQLKVGDKVMISSTPIDPTNMEQEFRTINYPIERITRK